MLSSMLTLILPILSLASQVSATTLAPRGVHELFTRQSTFDPSVIPAQCKGTCGIFTSTIATCQNSKVPSCGCSATEERGLVVCVNCILGTGTPSPDGIQNTQAFLDQYVILCNRAGVALPATTINGGVTGITSTPVAGTNTAGPTFASLTRTPTSVQQVTITGLGPAATGGAGAATPSPSNQFAGFNSASPTRGREASGAAIAVAIALVVFF